MSQKAQILKYLQEGYSITSSSARRVCGCKRLAARIYDIRKLGYDVKTLMVQDGDKYFAQYRMVV